MVSPEQLAELKEDIGEELYNQLTPEQREWVIQTEGSIDLGREFTEADFERIKRDLRIYKDF